MSVEIEHSNMKECKCGLSLKEAISWRKNHNGEVTSKILGGKEDEQVSMGWSARNW